MNGGSGEVIPEDVALQLCSEIRNEKKIKLFMQWGCVKFSKGDPAKMCFSSRTIEAAGLSISVMMSGICHKQ